MRITKELNERLTRTGPGTPMGGVFRRYWIPACLAEEVPEPDSPPVRVRLLGEDLIAFRDSSGQVGLVDAYCAHRRAPLFFARNEECGLRCVYHGWKYDVNGTCVDMPSEPPYSKFRLRVSIKAYPTHEAGGVVWTYMGPTERMPGPPDYEWLHVPATHARVSKTNEACNYMQAVEGGIDTAHSSFAHNNDLANHRSTLRGRDTHPRLEVDVRDHGFTYASLRNVSDGSVYLRVYQFLMPSIQLRGLMLSNTGQPARLPSIHGHVWVPIDDANVAVYNFIYSADDSNPISDEQWLNLERAMGRGPEHFVPGTSWLKLNLDNDFGIDRQMQRERTFTGITGINTQDFAIQTGMGPVVDRSLEALGSTDLAIQTARRILLEAADEVEADRDPRGTDPAAQRQARGADLVIEAGRDWREAAKSATEAYW